MILVQLHGGLGNQMFQAAAGLALSARLGVPLAFDLTRFRAKGLRGYALAPFHLDATIREDGRFSRIAQVWNRLTGDKTRPAGWSAPIFREPHFAYAPAFETLSAPVMLAGYFQSPRYWSGQEGQVRACFAPEKLLSPAGKALAAQTAGDTIAIHLRRGDYASDPAAASVHGVLDWAYYDRALARVREEHPDAHALVFSDNASAAAEAATRWPNASALAGPSAGDDFALMSLCRHHIIANSSFSWWSAWLDARDGGMRIAPKAWFTPAALKTRPIDDLLPKYWVTL